MKRAFALAACLVAVPALAQDEDNRAKVEGIDEGLDVEPVKPWAVEPWWEPISNLQGKFITGPTWSGNPLFSVILEGGVLGGVQYRQEAKPHLYGFTRGQGVTQFSITHGTLGLDGRIGSYFGVDGKWMRVVTGADFFYNVYGVNGFGADYFLPASPGILWETRASFKATKEFWISGWIGPGWAFDKDRNRTGIIDELNIKGLIAYFGEFDIAVGWQVSWNSAGRQHGPILMARFQ
jgi:hypothetical protein